MKKLLLSLALIAALPATFSQTILTHSTTKTIMAGNSVSCSATGIVQDNYMMRRFDLDDFGIVDTAFIVNFECGIESVVDGPYSVRVRVYELTDPFFFLGNMTYIIGDTFDLPADTALALLYTEFNPIQYRLPGDTLIGEVYTPTSLTSGCWVGSNNYYESDTSFMMAPGCAYSIPTPVDDIGFANSHWVINVGVNQRPKMTTVNEWMWKDDSLYLSKENFHTADLDPDLDTISLVRIKSLPVNGDLYYMGVAVAIDDTLTNPELDSLQYIPDAGYAGLDSFHIIVKDNYHWSLADSPVEIEIQDWVASIDEDEYPWEIYPNPVTEEMTINGFDKIDRIQVYDMSGKKVYFKAMFGETKLDISFLESGTYVLDVMNERGRFSKQFIKQ